MISAFGGIESALMSEGGTAGGKKIAERNQTPKRRIPPV